MMKLSRKIFFLVLMLSLSISTSSFSQAVKVRGEDVKEKLDVQIKILNGKNLPEYLKGAEPTDEAIKYLLITVVSKLEGDVFFTLKIRSKNNPNITLNLPMKLLLPSFEKRIPMYYLHYIEGPMMVVPEEETEFEWEIEDLYVH